MYLPVSVLEDGLIIKALRFTLGHYIYWDCASFLVARCKLIAGRSKVYFFLSRDVYG
jgi:hypothetical protein